MNILITGGLGFIGSHLCAWMNDDDLYCLDNMSNNVLTREQAALEYKELIVDDVAINSSISWYAWNNLPPMDLIIHLATHPRSLSDVSPGRNIDTNVHGVQNVIDKARDWGCPIIYTSNSGICGAPAYIPIDEAHPAQCSTVYDCTKLAGEHLIQCSGVPYTIFRLASVYGPAQRQAEGWKPVIATYCENIARGRPIEMSGDGKQTRDFIFVSDVVRAIVMASVKPPSNEMMLLGTNVETAIEDLIGDICQISGETAAVTTTPTPPGEIPRMRLTSDKALRVLGWKHWTSIEGGLAETYDWWIKHVREESAAVHP
jgi:UDP-glucose 4-epimerase